MEQAIIGILILHTLLTVPVCHLKPNELIKVTFVRYTSLLLMS